MPKVADDAAVPGTELNVLDGRPDLTVLALVQESGTRHLSLARESSALALDVIDGRRPNDACSRRGLVIESAGVDPVLDQS